MLASVLCVGALLFGAQALPSIGPTTTYTEDFEEVLYDGPSFPPGARNGLYFGNLSSRLTQDTSSGPYGLVAGDGLIYAAFDPPNGPAFLSSKFNHSNTAYFQVSSFDFGATAEYIEQGESYGYPFDTNYTITVKGYNALGVVVAKQKFTHTVGSIADQPRDLYSTFPVTYMNSYSLSPAFKHLTKFTWQAKLAKTTTVDTYGDGSPYENFTITNFSPGVDVITYSVTNKTLGLPI